MGLAWYAEKGPGNCMGPPDDSLVIAAESEYIRNAICDARKHLDDADNAAGNENVWKAKQAVQSALDVLSDLVED